MELTFKYRSFTLIGVADVVLCGMAALSRNLWALLERLSRERKGQSGLKHLLIVILIETVVPLVLGVFFAYLFLKIKRVRVKKLSPDAKAIHMPTKFLRSERSKLTDLPPGETSYIRFTEVAVDLSGATFVEENAQLQKESISTVGVRIANGRCVLILPKASYWDVKFLPRQLSKFTSYLPVTEIIESEAVGAPMNQSAD